MTHDMYPTDRARIDALLDQLAIVTAQRDEALKQAEIAESWAEGLLADQEARENAITALRCYPRTPRATQAAQEAITRSNNEGAS